VARAREVRPLTSRIGLVSTAVCDHPEIDGIVDDLAAMDYECRSPPCGSTISRRSSSSSSPTPASRGSPSPGVRLRPDAPRPQQAVHEREILDKATWIFENGIQNLKLYYMVGLPFEEHADVEAIVALTTRSANGCSRWRAGGGESGASTPR